MSLAGAKVERRTRTSDVLDPPLDRAAPPLPHWCPRLRGRDPPRAMAFHQTPPALGNQFDDDRVLRSTSRARSRPTRSVALAPDYARLGDPSGGELYDLQPGDRPTSRAHLVGTVGPTASTRSTNPPSGSARP